jgi:hypothetical protein
MDNQVVVQLGAHSCTFPPNVAAADVLLGVTGSPGGTVRHSVSGVMYAGGMLVPGGQYEVVPPQGEEHDCTLDRAALYSYSKAVIAQR